MKNRNRNKGSVLLLALLTIVLLLVAGLGLLALGFQSRVYQIRTGADIAARCAADAGLTKALYEVNSLFADGELDGDLPAVYGVSLDGSNATYSYIVTKNGGLYNITATGNSLGSERTVSAALAVSSPFDWAMFTENGFELKNSARVDWYNNNSGDAPMKVGTNSTKAGAIDLKNSSYINGDVVVGPGADPDTVITLKNSSKITGEKYAMDSTYTPPSVTTPSWLGSQSSKGNITNSTTLYSSGKYNKIELGNSKVLTIAGDVTIYVKEIELGNSAEIKILQNGSLTIYLDGKLEGKNASGFNNVSEDAKKLKIYGTDKCTSVEFKNSSAFYGAVHVANAYVEVKNSGGIYGAIIAKTLEMKNSANFYYDTSLRTVTDLAGGLKIQRWKE